MDLESFALLVLKALDISSYFNLKVLSLIFFLTTIGEANIHIPLLIESIWLLIGYQADANASSLSVLNLFSALLAAQMGRQIGIAAIYFLFTVISPPLSKFYMKHLQANKYYKKYRENEYLYNVKFLSLSSATLGLFTPLNGPIKVLLIVKRKLRVLLFGTLFSGMAFDVTYVLLGAVFHMTTLKLTYLPIFLLVGFLVLIFIKVRILK